MKLISGPPIREVVVEQTGRFREGMAIWLSDLAAKISVSTTTSYGMLKQSAASADSAVSITSPNATDLASALVLANELKTDVNQLVSDLNDLKTKLRTAGIIDT